MKNTITNKQGDPVIIEATALTPIAYKHIFGGDMLKDLKEIRGGDREKTDFFELCSQMAFVMATQAANLKDASAVMNADKAGYYEFLNDYESNYFQSTDVQGVILATWFNNASVIDKIKNLQSPPKEN